ncbi:MAG: 3-hydroxyacyl-CoA dehydrogenase family protein, partial [Pseudoalteromonas sp.]
FYVNRILAPYVNEAANLMLAGEPIEKIDQALVEFGFPVGPLALLDEVGIDIGSKIAPILETELGERFKAPDAFSHLIDAKRLGRKTGRGFYLYDKKDKKVDESVYELLGVSPAPRLNKSEIAKRCVAQMLNEAVRSLDDGIISSPRDGDIGAIFGIGFPPFLGGPFSYMDKQGSKKVCSEMATLANTKPIFAPCETLKNMADSGASFYQAEEQSALVDAAKATVVEQETEDTKGPEEQTGNTQAVDESVKEIDNQSTDKK